MSTFKLGDRVRDKAAPNEFATVIAILSHGNIRVRWDGTDGTEGDWQADGFERADPSPVITVTRKEIVPGKYGHIEIDGTNGAVQPEGVSLWFPANRRWSATDLRAAVGVLTALAEVLEADE